MAAITPKDPAEVLDYDFDWTDWLAGDTIVSAVVSVPTGLTLVLGTNQVTCSIVGSRVVYFVTDGVSGTTYKIRCVITTAAGRTGVGTMSLLVRAS